MYTRQFQFETLADALKRAARYGIEENVAKATITGAIADGKIGLRVRVWCQHQQVLATHVKPRVDLQPGDLDWINSRPLVEWHAWFSVGPARRPARRPRPLISGKIALIMLSIDDLEKALAVEVLSKPPADVADPEQPAQRPNKGGRPSDRERIITEAKHRRDALGDSRPATLAQLARDLHTWLQKQPVASRTHGKVTGLETIENHVRDIYNSWPVKG